MAFLGQIIEPSKSRDTVNQGTVNRGLDFSVFEIAIGLKCVSYCDKYNKIILIMHDEI